MGDPRHVKRLFLTHPSLLSWVSTDISTMGYLFPETKGSGEYYHCRIRKPSYVYNCSVAEQPKVKVGTGIHPSPFDTWGLSPLPYLQTTTRHVDGPSFTTSLKNMVMLSQCSTTSQIPRGFCDLQGNSYQGQSCAADGGPKASSGNGGSAYTALPSTINPLSQ